MYSASSISMSILKQRLRLAQPCEVSHQSWTLMKEIIQLYPRRSDAMQRLYLLYLNDCHEDVVHSFSTNHVGNKKKKKEVKSVEGKSNRDHLHGIWPAKSPSSDEDRHSGRYRAKISLAEPCYQAGTCHNPCRILIVYCKPDTKSHWKSLSRCDGELRNASHALRSTCDPCHKAGCSLSLLRIQWRGNSPLTPSKSAREPAAMEKVAIGAINQ